MSTQDAMKSIGDALSIGTVVATIAGWLPAIAALLTIIWTGIRIFETKTVRRWLDRKVPLNPEDV